MKIFSQISKLSLIYNLSSKESRGKKISYAPYLKFRNLQKFNCSFVNSYFNSFIVKKASG